MPSGGPPRVSRSASRLIAAATARRTFVLSNGLTVVFSAMKRVPSLATGATCSRRVDSAERRTLTGGAA